MRLALLSALLLLAVPSSSWKLLKFGSSDAQIGHRAVLRLKSRQTLPLQLTGSKGKRCVAHLPNSPPVAASPTTSVPPPAPESTTARSTETPTSSAQPTTSPTSSARPTSTSSSRSTAAAPTQSSGGGGGNTGVINVQSTCGDIGASREITTTTGPNGNIDWLNCGLNDDGGWQPQRVTLNDIVYQRDLRAALADNNSPFRACNDLVDVFERYANEFNVPAIFVASFAMQESSCNPDTIGGAGEQGLMQITNDKCGGAPNGNCRDIEYNVRTGTKYFADVLAGNNGDLFLTVGQYNGWRRGMTFASATAARNTNCCFCQNNLDYLHAFFNGWIQNRNAYSPRLGKYFNLDVCVGNQRTSE